MGMVIAMRLESDKERAARLQEWLGKARAIFCVRHHAIFQSRHQRHFYAILRQFASARDGCWHKRRHIRFLQPITRQTLRPFWSRTPVLQPPARPTADVQHRRVEIEASHTIWMREAKFTA